MVGGDSALGVMSNAGQDLVGSVGPTEVGGILAVDLDKFVDRGYQILHAPKYPPNSFVGEFRAVGGREVNV
jgi:hypothetical protein